MGLTQRKLTNKSSTILPIKIAVEDTKHRDQQAGPRSFQRRAIREAGYVSYLLAFQSYYGPLRIGV